MLTICGSVAVRACLQRWRVLKIASLSRHNFKNANFKSVTVPFSRFSFRSTRLDLSSCSFHGLSIHLCYSPFTARGQVGYHPLVINYPIFLILCCFGPSQWRMESDCCSATCCYCYWWFSASAIGFSFSTFLRSDSRSTENPSRNMAFRTIIIKINYTQFTKLSPWLALDRRQTDQPTECRLFSFEFAGRFLLRITGHLMTHFGAAGHRRRRSINEQSLILENHGA